MNILDEIRKMVFAGDEEKTLELVQKALDEGHDAMEIMDNGLVKGIEDCGAAYEEQQVWLPELMLATEAVKKSGAILIPKMGGGRAERSIGKVVLATVQGDVHDIGVELVSLMLESAGFSVKFMGGNVPTPDIIAAVREEEPQLLGLSTLLSNTMYVMPKILKILKAEGLRDAMKVMVGGAVIRQEFCEEIGADGYAPDAVSAVHVAKEKCRELAQKLKNIIIRLDTQGNITFLNEFAENLFGYKKEDVLGKSIVGTILPADDSHTGYPIAMLDNLLKTPKRDAAIETEAMCRSGERVWIAWRNKLIFDQGRNLAGVLCVGNDVTERKRSEEQLRFDETRFESLFVLTQMSEASMERMGQFVIEHAVRLTKSKVGFVGFLNEDETLLSIHSWSESAAKECAIADKTVHFPIEAGGLWAEAIRQRNAVIINDYSTDFSHKKNTPLGHVPLSRLMLLPAFDKDRTVAVAVVANKDEEYDSSDIRLVTLLMDSMWKLIQRKRAEEALRHSELQLRQTNVLLQKVVDGISDPLIMLSPDMSIILLNKAARNYYSVTESDSVFGRSCYEALRGRTSPCSDCGYPPSLKECNLATFERKGLFDPNRTEQVTVYVLSGNSGQPDCSIIRISDVTDQKIMQRQLIQTEKLASLGLLVSGITHEINNPNTFISFNIPILREYLQALLPIVDDHASRNPDLKLFRMPYARFRQDIFNLLDSMEHGSTRIKTIVDDLKRFVGTRDHQEMKLTNIRFLIDKAVAMCKVEIRKKIRHFDVDIPVDLPAINSNPEALEQVILNLLINAVQACDKKYARIRLSVRTGGSKERRLIIEVSDNGCGIEQRFKEKIFDPFFTTKSSSSGTGLGLYICHNLVGSLGGKIEVDSEVGQGSTFRVVLSETARRGL